MNLTQVLSVTLLQRRSMLRFSAFEDGSRRHLISISSTNVRLLGAKSMFEHVVHVIWVIGSVVIIL